MGDTIKLTDFCEQICKTVAETINNSFSNAVMKTEFGELKSYKLFNERRNHYLNICINSGYIRIEGSIRKWYFGGNSVLDFKDKLQFKKAICLLAKALACS